MDRDKQLAASEAALQRLRRVTDGYRVIVDKAHEKGSSDAFVALVAMAGAEVSRSLDVALNLIEIATGLDGSQEGGS